jgi:hypothetical protein
LDLFVSIQATTNYIQFKALLELALETELEFLPGPNRPTNSGRWFKCPQVDGKGSSDHNPLKCGFLIHYHGSISLQTTSYPVFWTLHYPGLRN